MKTLIRRDDVVRRITSNKQTHLVAAVDRINGILQDAMVLPVVIAEDILPTGLIMEEVARMLKQAGWRVDKVVDEEKKMTFWQLS